MRGYDILYVGCLPRLPYRPDAPTSGGMEMIAAAALNRLATRGHDVRVLAPLSATDQAGHFGGVGPEVAISTYTVPGQAHRPTLPSHFDLHARHIQAGLRRLLRERPADLILVGHAAYVGAFPEAARAHRVPWLVWVHSILRPMIFGDGLAPAPLAQQILTRMQTASGLVCVARHIAADLTAMCVGAATVVPNGIDLTLFHPRRRSARLRTALGLAPDDIVVAHASNLKQVKRIGDLVGSAEVALKHDPRLVYLIVGDGPHMGEIAQACQVRGLADRFRLTGWLPQDEVARHLSLADIAVLPSAAEGLPLALLEAMASGCAAIASDIAAAREVLRHGENGLLFPVGDVAALTEHTLALAASPERRATLAANGQRSVARQYGADLMIERLEALFDSVAAASPATA